jgi:hypothetical protein
MNHASRRMLPALGAAALLSFLLLASSALAGPTVKVRIEGESSTLLPLTTVTLEKPDPFAPGCPYNSANAAINLGVESVGGSWDHGNAEGSDGDFTETILGETHIFEQNETTWDVWINDKWGGGICEDLLSEGDEVLMVADYDPKPAYAPTRLPLIVSEVPASAQTGVPFTVQVDKVHTRPGTYPEVGEGTPELETGVTVSGGGGSAESNANGVATLTLALPGTYTLTALKPGDAPSAPVSVCVRESGKSGCGVQISTSSSGGSTSASGTTVGAPYTGPFAIVAKATGLIDGYVYKRGHAPRVLQGTVDLHGGGLQGVKLRLTRTEGRKCSYYDGVTERFHAMRCGAAHGVYFSVGSNASFSYLLPETLPPGRYVLDIEATDTAGEHTTLARGTSRIVFYVK